MRLGMIQELYLAGRKQDAARAVPEKLARGMSLAAEPAKRVEDVAALASLSP